MLREDLLYFPRHSHLDTQMPQYKPDENNNKDTN